MKTKKPAARKTASEVGGKNSGSTTPKEFYPHGIAIATDLLAPQGFYTVVNKEARTLLMDSTFIYGIDEKGSRVVRVALGHFVSAAPLNPPTPATPVA